MDALSAAIRAALDLLSKKDPETYALAREKCRVERELRAAGHSRSEARRIVHRTFKIQKLGD
jgi:hypothetical protein